MRNFSEVIKQNVKLEEGNILKKGYGLIPQEVSRNKNLSVQARFIYSYLASFAGADGVAYPTQSLMIEELGMNSATFYKYLKEILCSGYIKVTQTRQNGKMYKNVYTLATNTNDLETNRRNYLSISIKNKKKAPNTVVNNLVQSVKKSCTEICDSKSNSSKNNIVVEESQNTQLVRDYNFEINTQQIKLIESLDLHILKEAVETTVAKGGKAFSYIFEVYKTIKKKAKTTITKTATCNTTKNSKKDDVQEFKYKKTKFHNFDSTYCDLEDDILNDMIEMNQNKKYNII